MDWSNLTRGAKLSAEGPFIAVDLSGPNDPRRQKVRVGTSADGELRIWSPILSPGSVRSAPGNGGPGLWVWNRNPEADLAGLRLDHRGRPVGEGFLPAADLCPDKLGFLVGRVAEICDRALDAA